MAKKKNKNDLALFYSVKPCVSAGMFTSNIVKAAPVKVSEKHLLKRGTIRAIVANSGCANACTGIQGMSDAEKMCDLTAKNIDCKPSEVLVASTGVIGQNLPMDKVRLGIKRVIENIGATDRFALESVRAIMTTDTVPKIEYRKVSAGNRSFSIWGCVKGSGMIHPDLRKLHATMLSFILTDAKISRQLLEKALYSSIQRSFNCVSVDSDTSTNDSVIVLANGEAGKVDPNNFKVFCKVLDEVCIGLAKKNG